MPNYLAHDEPSDTIVAEYQDYQKMRLSHSRPYRQFNSSFDGTIRSLREYIDYSYAKFNQFTEIPEDSEHYEVHLAFPNIRNKMMAILSKLSAQRMKAEVYPQNIDQPFDQLISKVLGYLLEWSDEEANQDWVNFQWMLETAIKGTGILCEDFSRTTREIKDIKEYDPITGKSKWRKKTLSEEKCVSFVIPLEEFYVWNVREPMLAKQRKMAWVYIMDFKDFQWIYRKYPRVKEVMPGTGVAESQKPFFNEFLSYLTGGSVEVMRVWNQEEDTFRIFANGTELTEPDNPIPFKHKRSPLSVARYELIQQDFFYGKSFPDKTGNITDAIDQTFNDLFNLNQINLKSPLVAKEGTVMQDTVWRPDSIITYHGDTPPMPLPIARNTQDTDKVFNLLQDQLNLSSVAPVSQGQTGSGSTAREVIIAQENSLELISMFLRMMEWGEKDRAYLRISNLLQFLTQPKIKEVVGNDSQKLLQYKTVFQHGVQLENGKIGVREIRFKAAHQVTPPSILEQEQSPTREIIEISVEFIRDLRFYIKVVPNSSVKTSQTLKKALDLEFVKTVMTFFPQQVNVNALVSEIMQDFDKNPEKFMTQQPEQNPEEAAMQKLFGQIQTQGQAQFSPVGGQQRTPVMQGMMQGQNTLGEMARL